MKKFILITGSLLLAGCMTVAPQTGSTETGSFPKELKSVSQMRSVKPGMLTAEVRSLLDESITIGYQQAQEGQPYIPLLLSNPYRFETVKNAKKVLEVYYYFAGIRQADGKITDDELIPLVFENDKLIGRGWNFLRKANPTE